ncbi:MAG: protease PrsW [Chloroflexi bacterium]|nr:MAG: protease PrsW [Chloroflexota bacterium]MBL1195420.1 protease PrsW [Chloroflexota bacterium]NOH12703.1 PrsW family intramembrane metalloprotease [Chloroflexota bacterium]
MALIAYAIAALIPLLVLYIIYSLDLYRTGTFRYTLLSFLWGSLAFLLASSINRYLIGNGVLERLTVVQFTAPIMEELLKALVLIYLVRRPKFTYFVDGAIYGFAIGIGFAIFENFEYINTASAAALGTAIGRVISTNLIHATASAIIGIAFGLARFHRTAGRGLVIALGFVIGMALHIGFNNLVTRVESGPLLLYAGAVGIAGLLLIAWAIRRGLTEEKVWIEETLGEADRVTTGEAAVVHRLNDLELILAPLAQRFGPHKASQIEAFLTLQARLGIMRKTLDKLQDEKTITAVQTEMDTVREEMDAARQEVGTYAMMYLRSIFPADDSPLWSSLENSISENKSSGKLWGTLESQMSERKATESSQA